MDLDKKYLTERLASRGKNINDARADDDNFFNMITSYLAACSGKDNILSSRDDIDISQYHDKVKNFKTALQELKTTNEEMEAIAWLTKTDKKPNTVKKEKRKSTSRVEEMKAIMKRFDEERSISALKNEIKGLNGVNLEEVLHEMEHMVTVISKLKKDKKSLEIVLEKTKNEHFEDTLRQTDELITASAEHKKEKNDLEKKLRDSRNDLDNIKHELNTKTVEFLKVISEHNEERTKIENELKKIKNELEVANGELNTVAGKHLPLSVESKKENIFLKNQLNKIKQDLEKAKQKSKEENQFSKGQLKECKHESERVKEELKKEKYFMETQLQEYKNALEMAREELQEERKSKNSQLKKHESTSTEAEKEFARQKLFLNNKMQKYKNECNAIEDFIDTYLHEGISKTCKDLKFEQSPITNKLNSFIHNFQGIREERDLLHKNLQKLEEQSQKVQYSKKEWSELENILSSVQIPENNSSEVCEGEDSLQSTVLDKTKTLIRDFELIKIENKFVTEGLEMKLKHYI